MALWIPWLWNYRQATKTTSHVCGILGQDLCTCAYVGSANHWTVSPASLSAPYFWGRLSLYCIRNNLGLPRMYNPPACAFQVQGLQAYVITPIPSFYYFAWKWYIKIKTLLYLAFLSLWQIHFYYAVYRILSNTLIDNTIHWSADTSMRTEHSIAKQS